MTSIQHEDNRFSLGCRARSVSLADSAWPFPGMKIRTSYPNLGSIQLRQKSPSKVISFPAAPTQQVSPCRRAKFWRPRWVKQGRCCFVVHESCNFLDKPRSKGARTNPVFRLRRSVHRDLDLHLLPHRPAKTRTLKLEVGAAMSCASLTLFIFTTPSVRTSARKLADLRTSP